jgi:hypothetical protein
MDARSNPGARRLDVCRQEPTPMRRSGCRSRGVPCRVVSSTINAALMRLSRRAETSDLETLVQTFVDTGPLFHLIQSHDHQVIFGRRGTGKTHLLYFLADVMKRRNDLAVYLDLRMIGSTGGIYNDRGLPLAERGTRLILDVLESIHNALVDFALEASEEHDLTPALVILDSLADEITSTVRVVGSVERETEEAAVSEDSRQAGAKIRVSTSPAIEARSSDSATERATRAHRYREAGVAEHSVHFGAVGQHLNKLLEALPVARLWILLDEWSSIPIDLQPLLADLLKRCLLPVRRLTVKIAAIEQRSEFSVPRDGDYLGLEIGADVAADLDLDDFLVFGNDAERAKEFFGELLFRHVAAICQEQGITTGVPSSAHEFIQQGFTQQPTFAELVRAAEGVPRDAINVANLSAMRADDQVVSLPVVRGAARTWYLRDKESAAGANPEARALLHWIIDKVIGARQARAFLLRQGDDLKHPLIRTLYDARVLHVVKKGVSSKDQPGVRFNVYGLDYGCYVELITTVKEPKGLFEAEIGDEGVSYIQVPMDDYRSIRRAVLDLGAFEASGEQGKLFDAGNLSTD